MKCVLCGERYPRSSLRDTPVRIWEKEDARLPDWNGVTHKGDRGRTVVIGGERGMCGAVIFAGMSALRMGAGLVEVHTHPENRIPVQTLLPEAVMGFWGEENRNPLSSADAIAVGMGLGLSEMSKEALTDVLDACRPTVYDADALNLFARHKEKLDRIAEGSVLTPHLAEFSRLTGKTVEELKETLPETALAFARRYGTVTVVKAGRPFIATPAGDLYENDTGSWELSTGGTGDILSGMIASLMGQGYCAEKAALTALFYHGLAGKKAGDRVGHRSVMARDVIDAIGVVTE